MGKLEICPGDHDLFPPLAPVRPSGPLKNKVYSERGATSNGYRHCHQVGTAVASLGEWRYYDGSCNQEDLAGAPAPLRDRTAAFLLHGRIKVSGKHGAEGLHRVCLKVPKNRSAPFSLDRWNMV